MSKKLYLTVFVALAGVIIFAGSAMAQFMGTHTYSIQVGSIDQGYLTVTFNPDGTITGEARLSGRKPLPVAGIYGRTVFVIKYVLEDGTEILDHCRFVSEEQFIGFERYIVNGTAKGITKITGLRKDNI